METINKNKLLDCLVQSNLTKQFFNDTEDICIQKEYILTEINITSDEELKRILLILRYWMVDNLPNEVYEYVINIKHHNVDLIGLSDYKPVNELKLILDYNYRLPYYTEYNSKRNWKGH